MLFDRALFGQLIKMTTHCRRRQVQPRCKVGRRKRTALGEQPPHPVPGAGFENI